MSANVMNRKGSLSRATYMLLLSASLLLSGLSAASAQEGNVTESNGAVTFTEGQVIRVKVPRPSVSYVLSRRRLRFRSLEPKQSFLPAIYESVKKPPF